MKTAKTLGLTFPIPLLGRADKVIENNITMLFAAVHESAFGTKRTSLVAPHMSAFGGKADMCRATRDVRFVPKADTAEGFFE